MQRLGTWLAVLALLVAACTDAPAEDGATVLAPAPTTSAPPPVTTSEAQAPTTGIVLPDVLDFDTGALEVTPQPTTEEGFVTLLDDLRPRGPGDPGVVLDLTECHLLAPGQWKVSGTIEAPAEAIGAEIGMHIGFAESDVVIVTPVRATIRGSGEFAIPLDFVAISRIEGARTQSDLRDRCNLQVAGATTPVDTFSNSGPTRFESSLGYEAPEGSLQALGIGADLGDSDDPRRSWAYATYYQRDIPFEEVWLSTDATLLNSGTGHGLCRTIETSYRDRSAQVIVQVIQSRDCRKTRSGVATDLDGWFEVSGSRTPQIYRTTEDGLISISGFAGGTVDDLLDIAATLELVPNAAYRPPEGVSPDLEEAIAMALAGDGWTERGRRELDDRWIVAAVRRDVRDDDKLVWYRSAVFEMIRTSDELWTTARPPRARGASTTTCLIAKKLPSYDSLRILSAILAEEDWTLQARIDGEWRDLETFGSAYMELAEATADVPEYRALDAAGGVVRCATDATTLADGERWSDYQSSDQGGIAIDALPDRVAVETLIQVTGSGAYPKKDVVIGLCHADTIGWVDRRDCDRTREIRVNVDLDGSFNAAIPIRATITTALGDTFDCRVDECVIRADTVRGIHRSGWVPFTIREDG